jgi:hypothetical protein
MRRRILVIGSVVAVVAVALAAAISPAIYRGQSAASTTGTSITASTSVMFNGQCRKADPNATYPLVLQIWTPSGEPVRHAWIILYDWDRGIPFEEGYNLNNGTYRSKHAFYSPSQNMTLMIQNDQYLQSYVVNVVIPDLVCDDGYIHVQVNAS